MEAYSDFAQVYDIFMDETPYEQWSQFLQECFAKYGVKPQNLVLDLGCGTGTLTRYLAQAGYDMIGVDNSQEMLAIAMEKQAEGDNSILYLLQDMREFELYGTVRAVVSVCDSINYLLEEEEVLQTFRLVNNYLDPGGVFVFDFNTSYKYEYVIGDSCIAENREDCSFIWENYYDAENQINEYEVTVFVQEEAPLYRKFTETHYQRGYTVSQMERLLKKAGLNVLECIDADTHKAVTETSERVYFVAKECIKASKEA